VALAALAWTAGWLALVLAVLVSLAALGVLAMRRARGAMRAPVSEPPAASDVFARRTPRPPAPLAVGALRPRASLSSFTSEVQVQWFARPRTGTGENAAAPRVEEDDDPTLVQPRPARRSA
jgi:hypothetical protein